MALLDDGGGTDFNSGASTTTWADYGSGTTWFQASATNNVVKQQAQLCN